MSILFRFWSSNEVCVDVFENRSYHHVERGFASWQHLSLGRRQCPVATQLLLLCHMRVLLRQSWLPAPGAAASQFCGVTTIDPR